MDYSPWNPRRACTSDLLVYDQAPEEPQGEARTVQRIAVRLSPKAPLKLLNSANGQEYLVGDLDKRIAKRQGERRVLEKLKSRLIVGGIKMCMNARHGEN